MPGRRKPGAISPFIAIAGHEQWPGMIRSSQYNKGAHEFMNYRENELIEYRDGSRHELGNQADAFACA